MARLKRVPSRLSSSQSKLGRSDTPRIEADRHRERDKRDAWRAWYKTARWQRLRQVVIARDKWRCRATGVLVNGKYPAPNSAVVDHIKPHRGDAALFWDQDNLQTVSKEYHDKVKQSRERRGLA